MSEAARKRVVSNYTDTLQVKKLADAVMNCIKPSAQEVKA
jgi:hypothetical protein